MVTTIEALALATGQQLVDAHGTRAFGGHTLRVTGAQLLAALGLEVMKIRIFARHGGDTILRYVAEAPLRTLRSDLGVQQSSTSAAAKFGPPRATADNAPLRKRLQRLEQHVVDLQKAVQVQASDLVSVATGFAVRDDRIFVQNLVTATVHAARPADGGHTLCGWRYATARRRCGGGGRRLQSLAGLPGTMLCDRCLTTERAIAMAGHAVDISGDEHDISGDEQTP
jgi:hypothetical protein